MSYVIFGSQEEAVRFQAQVDTLLGYPKWEVLTFHRTFIIPHPDGVRWAHDCPGDVAALLPSIRVMHVDWILPDPCDLDASWTYADPKVPT